MVCARAPPVSGLSLAERGLLAAPPAGPEDGRASLSNHRLPLLPVAFNILIFYFSKFVTIFKLIVLFHLQNCRIVCPPSLTDSVIDDLSIEL